MKNDPPPRRHRNYHYERGNMMRDKIWFALGNSKFIPNLINISKHYDVPVDCLKYWRKKLTKDINWVPDQGHAEQQRIFSKETEAEIKDTVLEHVDKGVPVNYASLSMMMMNVHQKNLEANQDKPILKRQEDFNASPHFLQKFCDRNDLSIRRAHVKRRPHVTEGQIDDFRAYVKSIINNKLVSSDHILNCDETFWHITEQRNYTLARTGQDKYSHLFQC